MHAGLELRNNISFENDGWWLKPMISPNKYMVSNRRIGLLAITFDSGMRARKVCKKNENGYYIVGYF